MPFTKVYLHLVWTTKNRNPYLNTFLIRAKVWEHIFQNAKSKSILIDTINGFSDHCHCLIRLKPDQTIQSIMHLIKGESSFWVNKQDLLSDTPYTHFEWQDEYYVVSVSPRALSSVRNYINNQEEHHRINSFRKEFNDYLNKNGFQMLK